MANIINPRDFLMRLKSEGITSTLISPSDLLEIAELGITIPLVRASNVEEFYDILKKAVSDFNADAALTDGLSQDFDDLYTKYSEYIEALNVVI